MASNNSSVFALLAFIGFASFSCINCIEPVEYRLSKSVVPVSYDIKIIPRIFKDNDHDKQGTFDGEVSIFLKAVQPGVTKFAVHQKDLELKNIYLYDPEGVMLQNINDLDHYYQKSTEKLTMYLYEALVQNKVYKLLFYYTGLVRKDGFFVSLYTDENDEPKLIALSQMQRNNARYVFPCFDEPGFKATFRLHIGRPKDYQVQPNNEIFNHTPYGDSRVIVSFKTTPKMSTFLVAFVICDYRFWHGDHEFMVFARRENFIYQFFGFNVGFRALREMNKLLDQPYFGLGIRPLKFFPFPAFPHNCIDNWGIVICNEKILLHIRGVSDGIYDKELTIRIVSNKISLMWFGNSVTISWWCYLWLSEGFGRYFEYFLAHKLYPEYQLDQQFIVNEIHYILTKDADLTTQPLSSPESSISTPSEIASKFGNITYCKGAAFIRMVANIMGEFKFNKAIHEYLKEHYLESVVPADLFQFFKKHWPSPKGVYLNKFFSDWTEQVGYPMVIVNASIYSTSITLMQRRFLYNTTDGSDATLLYIIPITIATNLFNDFKNLTPYTYLTMEGEILNFRLTGPIKWVVVNKLQSNYYRVFYDEPILRQLQAALMKPGHSGIPVENRAQIIDDLFNFAHADLLDYVDVLKFLEYMCEETEYLPWSATFTGLQLITKRLTVEQLEDFGVYLTDISRKVYNKLGFRRDNDTVLDVYHRNKLISWLCKYGDTECNREAKMELSFLMSIGRIPLDFRLSLYCSASRAGSYSKVYHIYEYKQHRGETEQERLWLGASCTKDYKKHYENAILNNETSIERKLNGISQLYVENPENITPIFVLLSKDVKRLAAALESWRTTANMFRVMAEYFTTEEQMGLFQIFIFQNGTLFGLDVSILVEACSKVKSNLAMAEKKFARTVEYLKLRNGSSMQRPVASVTILAKLLNLIRDFFT